jgi:hypothetical protein
MRRVWLLVALVGAGCALPRWDESPLLARANPFDTGNECMLPSDQPGPEAYAFIFERVLDVLDDDFEIAVASRYDGRIETKPRIAPGLEQPWKAGSPNLAERTLATLQTYRHRCFVLIQPAERGYTVNVTVFKELEDLPQPTRDTGGGAAFRSDPSVDRQYEIVDPAIVSHVWIPKGRDIFVEQKILRKIRWAVRD